MTRPEIPHDKIPKGVKMCIENSQRLYDDALSPRKDKKYNGAIVNVILASEELVKGLLLHAHYEKGETIPPDKVELYFSRHGLRLKEFSNFFYKSLPRLDKKLAEEFSKNFWNIPKEDREKLIYVDWTAKGWFNPKDAILSLPGDEDEFAEVRFKMYELNFKHVLSTILKDQDFLLSVCCEESKITLTPSQTDEIIPSSNTIDYAIIEGNDLDGLEVMVGDGKNYHMVEPEVIQEKSPQHKKIIKIPGAGIGLTRYRISNCSMHEKTFVCKIISVIPKQYKD